MAPVARLTNRHLNINRENKHFWQKLRECDTLANVLIFVHGLGQHVSYDNKMPQNHIGGEKVIFGIMSLEYCANNYSFSEIL